MTAFRAFIHKLEDSRTSNTFLLLGAWLFLRIFAEGVLEAHHRIGYIPFSYKALLIYFVHYPVFYVSIFLIIVLLVSIIIKEHITKVTNICAAGFGIIIMVPVLDMFIGGGYTIMYPLRIGPYILQSLNPLASIIEYGASPGQRIVFAIICIGTAGYAFLKTKNLLKTVLVFCATYITIILLGGLPTLAAGNRPETVYITGGILYSDTQKYTSLFALLLIIALILYLLRLGRESYYLLLRSLRPLRAAFYGFMGIFGLLLALHQSSVVMRGVFPFFFDKIGLLIIWLSLAIGFQAAAAINDFFDREGDALSRVRNPLCADYPVNNYLIWTVACVALAFILSFIIHYVALLVMITLISLSIVYSVPPIRLKRIPIISSFTLSLATILAMTFGYSVIDGSQALNNIPLSILFPTLIGTTLGFTAKDIQDVQGDRVSRVVTLPLLLIPHGGIFGRAITALVIGISYLVYPLFIPQLLTGSIVASAVTISYILTIRRPREWVFFLFLFLFGAYILLMLPRLPVFS